jgi:glycerol transport system substrate-binding protein
MDYGKKDPSLGWRFTDAWLSMAGNGDKGLPNGLPVDEWGIKVDENSPRSVPASRAAATPTARLPSIAIQKYSIG